MPVATEGGGEDRRACGVVTLPGPQVPCPVSDGPTASPDLVPTTPEERSVLLGERWRKGCVNVEMVMTTSRK